MLSIFKSFVDSFSFILGHIYLMICTESFWRMPELLVTILKVDLGLAHFNQVSRGFHFGKDSAALPRSPCGEAGVESDLGGEHAQRGRDSASHLGHAPNHLSTRRVNTAWDSLVY